MQICPASSHVNLRVYVTVQNKAVSAVGGFWGCLFSHKANMLLLRVKQYFVCELLWKKGKKYIKAVCSFLK